MLQWSIHNADGDLMAITKHAEDAAAFVALIGDGATVRNGGKVLWTEGAEDIPAAESYDAAASTILERDEMRKGNRAAP